MFNYLAIAATSPLPPSALSMSEPSISFMPDDPWENSTLPATPSVEEVLLLGWQANTELRLSTKSLRRLCISFANRGGASEGKEVFIGMWYTWRLSLASSSPERDQLEDSSNSQQICNESHSNNILHFYFFDIHRPIVLHFEVTYF